MCVNIEEFLMENGVTVKNFLKSSINTDSFVMFALLAIENERRKIL